MSAVLQVKNLTTTLKIGSRIVPIVDRLSFDLHAGKTLSLVGESGCGKSLTALSLMRILPESADPNSSGEVIYQEKNLLSLPEKQMRNIRGSHLAMIFQDPTSALNPVYTIGNQLMEVVELHLNLFGEEAFDKVICSLQEVGIPSPHDRFYNYPHQLSGGMRQRVMIAMALICQPDVLIADEPTTALDVTIQAQILDLIRSLQKDRGMAVLLITHDMGLVAEMADDVIVMYAAQSVETGTTKNIFNHMAHPYTQGLFASRPSIHKARNSLHTIKGSVPPPTQFPNGCRFNPRCPFVMPKCLHGEVPNFSVKDEANHLAKCWLLEGDHEPK